MRRLILLMGMVAVLVFISVRDTSAQAAASDANLDAASDVTSADVEAALDQASNAALDAESDIEPAFRGEVCGTAIIPGPRTSAAIQFHVRNQVNDLIDFVILDPFSAFGRRSLPIQSVFGITPPAGGAVTDRYPDGANDGKGPVVLQTTSFNNGETLIFSTDPDTYDNPAFGATVLQMNLTEIETVYVATGRRCFGRFVFKAALNRSEAILKQVSPVP